MVPRLKCFLSPHNERPKEHLTKELYLKRLSPLTINQLLDHLRVRMNRPGVAQEQSAGPQEQFANPQEQSAGPHKQSVKPHRQSMARIPQPSRLGFSGAAVPDSHSTETEQSRLRRVVGHRHRYCKSGSSAGRGMRRSNRAFRVPTLVG